MVGIGRGFEVILVTAGALHRRSGKIIAQRVLVAGITVCCSMYTYQWKSQIGMLLKQVLAIFPTLGGMTALTLSTQLAPMYVTVAVDTLILRFREFQVAVAGSAGSLFMGADQRKASVLVRKSAIGPKLGPGIRSMAGFTLQRNVAVGVPRTS